MLSNCENLSELPYLSACLGPLLLWWAHLDRGREVYDSRWLSLKRFKALTFAIVCIEMLVFFAYLAITEFYLFFGFLLGCIVCLREALDPTQPSLWHHRRIRPLALLAIPGIGALGAWLIASPDLCASITCTVLFSRYVQNGAQLREQSLGELGPLRQKIQTLDAALKLQNTRVFPDSYALGGTTSNTEIFLTTHVNEGLAAIKSAHRA